MDYSKYASGLKQAAENMRKTHPELPDVVSTYHKCAVIIEELLQKQTKLEDKNEI